MGCHLYKNTTFVNLENQALLYKIQSTFINAECIYLNAYHTFKETNSCSAAYNNNVINIT